MSELTQKDIDGIVFRGLMVWGWLISRTLEDILIVALAFMFGVNWVSVAIAIIMIGIWGYNAKHLTLVIKEHDLEIKDHEEAEMFRQRELTKRSNLKLKVLDWIVRGLLVIAIVKWFVLNY